MARNEVDLIDIGALIIIPYFGGVAFEAMNFTISVFGGFDFAAAFWSGSGVTISNAAVITMAALAWIAATNLVGNGGLTGAAAKSQADDTLYQVLVIVAFAILPAYVFVPPVTDFINGSDVAKLVSVIALSALSVAISYKQ